MDSVKQIQEMIPFRSLSLFLSHSQANMHPCSNTCTTTQTHSQANILLWHALTLLLYSTHTHSRTNTHTHLRTTTLHACTLTLQQAPSRKLSVSVSPNVSFYRNFIFQQQNKRSSPTCDENVKILSLEEE